MGEYLEYNGRLVTREQLHREIVEQAARNFAFDEQLYLFPDKKLEAARKELRTHFESGKPLEIILSS